MLPDGLEYFAKPLEDELGLAFDHSNQFN